MDFLFLVATAIFSVIFVNCLFLLATMNTRYWNQRGVISVYSLPLFGVMLDVLIKRKGLPEIINEIYHKLNGERFGGYFQFTFPFLMLRDPQLINHILTKDFMYFEDRGPTWRSSSDLFSSGIANLTGSEWRISRHKLAPFFSSCKMKIMFHPITQCSDSVVTYLQDHLNQDINAKELSLKYIIKMIARIAFGLHIDTMNGDKENEFFRVSRKFIEPSPLFMIKLVIAMSVPKLREFIDFKVLDSHVEDFFRKLTEDLIKYRLSTGAKRNDFLQMMLDEREKELSCNSHTLQYQDYKNENISEEESVNNNINTTKCNNTSNDLSGIFTDEFIASQTFLFISGGSESTSTVLSLILFELAVNKEYQTKMQEEIDDILSSTEFNYQAVNKMMYMEQFINETMRCHPITEGLMRVCTKDYKIPGTDVTVDKGTFAFIPIVSLHKDPQYFPEPEIFNPDRFEDMDSIPKGVFFSFGGGPRICIAMRLAMLEMKIFLAKLLQNYDVYLSDKTKVPLKPIKSAFLLNIEGGIWVKFRKRQASS